MVKNCMASVSGKKKRRRQYSKGELNRLIDDLVHPLADQRPELMILDTFLHACVERNPRETATKFVRYSLPEIIRKIIERS
jgi:uncharacterized protein (DUF362 family)